jgi:predicted nucleotidyltransferase
MNRLELAIREVIQQSLDLSVVGILAYGSATRKKKPRDVDLLIVVDSKDRRYRVLEVEGFYVEVEYVPAPYLEALVKNSHWWYEDLELELAKFTHGKIIFDEKHILESFRRRILEWPIEIRLFLYPHRIGLCLQALEKLKRRKLDPLTYLRYHYLFLKNIAYFAHVIGKTFPVSTELIRGLKPKYIKIVSGIQPDCNYKNRRETLDHLILCSQEYAQELYGNREELSIKYISQYQGLKYALTKLKIHNPLIERSNVLLDSLGKW